MTAKEFLEQYRNADKMMRIYKREYQEQLMMIDAVQSLSGRDGTPAGSGISKPTEARALALVDRLERYKDAYYEAYRVRDEVLNVVAQIPNSIGEILYARYVLLLKWDDVAERVHYSTWMCHRLHRKGLEQVQHLIESHTKQC